MRDEEHWWYLDVESSSHCVDVESRITSGRNAWMVAQEAATQGGDWYGALQKQVATNIALCQARHQAKVHTQCHAVEHAI